MILKDIIDNHSTQLGETPAIRHKKEKVSYSELPTAINRIKQNTDFLACARVAVILPDGIGTSLLYLQLFLSQATVIPISIRSTTLHIENLLRRVKPEFVCTTRVLYKKHAILFQTTHCVIVEHTNKETPKFELMGAKNIVPDRSSWDKYNSMSGDDIRVVLFTSGSTGEPKGVCLSESNILSAASMMAEFLDLEPGRQTLVTPPSFDYYGFIQIFGHMIRGSGFIVGESIAFMGSMLKAIEEGLATDLAIVPYSLQQLLNVLENKPKNTLNKLSFVTSSSDTLSETLLQRSFAMNPNLTFFDIYGLTEAGRACYKKIKKDSSFSTSLGIPSTGVQLILDKSENEQQVGEIIIKGPNVAKGYFVNIVNSRIEIDPIDLVRTGDLGYLNNSGDIVLIGRKDHMINIMGEKIHPSEIETLAMMVDGIQDAVARPKEKSDGINTICLDIVCAKFDSVTEAKLLELILNRLGRAFVPETVNSVSRIERTELGSKVIRK